MIAREQPPLYVPIQPEIPDAWAARLPLQIPLPRQIIIGAVHDIAAAKPETNVPLDGYIELEDRRAKAVVLTRSPSPLSHVPTAEVCDDLADELTERLGLVCEDAMITSGFRCVMGRVPEQGWVGAYTMDEVSDYIEHRTDGDLRIQPAHMFSSCYDFGTEESPAVVVTGATELQGELPQLADFLQQSRYVVETPGRTTAYVRNPEL